jgi:hypothetical protein
MMDIRKEYLQSSMGTQKEGPLNCLGEPGKLKGETDF